MGNLQLFIPGEEGRLQFNAYAHFMTHFPLVKILSYLTYFSILFHAVDGIALTLQNRAARPVKYAYSRPDKNSKWAARNMALLGTILLLFIILHMRSFWYEMHWGPLGTDSAGNRDLYTPVVVAFKQWWFTLLYVLCMVSLGYHLSHGFASGFQSLGLRHQKYTPIIKAFGTGFAIIVPLLFASICVYLYVAG